MGPGHSNGLLTEMVGTKLTYLILTRDNTAHYINLTARRLGVISGSDSGRKNNVTGDTLIMFFWLDMGTYLRYWSGS